MTPAEFKSRFIALLPDDIPDDLDLGLDAFATFPADRASGQTRKSADVERVADFLATYYAAQAPATVRPDVFRVRLREHIEENESQLLKLAKNQEERD